MRKMALLLSMLLFALQLFPGLGGLPKAYAAMDGNGTEEDPFIVMTPQDLSDIRNNLTAYYRLGADIDLAGFEHDGDTATIEGWLPIDGSGSITFTGTLDGNGYAIRNMTINRPALTFVGLFGRVGENGKLSNIRLLDVDVTGSEAVGSLAGNLTSGTSTVENSFATGRAQTGNANLGGLVGTNASGKIQNSYAIVDVSGWSRIGGLVGTNSGTIENSFAAGAVNAGNNEVGGLVGYMAAGSIQSVYSLGKVNGIALVGGLVGRRDGGSSANAFWNTETSGQGGSALGSGKTTAELKDADTFAGWDSAVWRFRDRIYPYLLEFPIGVGMEPLASAVYSLDPGQDALSVTGNVYHETANEPIAVRYVIRSSAGVVATETVNAAAGDDGELALKRKFPLVAYTDGSYTLTVTATDSQGNAAGATLSFAVDSAAASPPLIEIATDGSETWAKTASSVVNVSDSGGGIDAASLAYVWSTDTVTPGLGAGWTSFESGDTLSLGSVDGDWYLHVRAKDDVGLTANVTSGRFRLDTSTAQLSALSLSAGTLNDAFDEAVYTYSATVANGISSITVMPASDAVTDTITASVNEGTPQSVTSGAASGALALNVGANQVEVTVTALNGEQHTYRITVTRISLPPPAGPSTIVDTDSPPPNPATIYIGSLPLNPATIDTTQPKVELEVIPANGAASVRIPVAALLMLAERNESFLLEIVAPYGRYQVPVNLVKLIPGLEALLAEYSLNAEDISFNINLVDKSDDPAVAAAFGGGFPQGKPLGAIVDFNVEIVNARTGQAIGQASRFSRAITRTIPLPRDVAELPQHWGAFRYEEETGEFGFVPATTARIEGVWYVNIAATTNSVYAVAEQEIGFLDVADSHWGVEEIELAASKGLVKGTGKELFMPNREITRAEFTVMLSRALGQEADAAFAGSPVLTRQEMAAMLADAARQAREPGELTPKSLAHFTDVSSIAAAYAEDVSFIFSLGIMNGTSAVTFGPQGAVTRAQAAAVLVRMLRKLEMIDGTPDEIRV